jgi:4-amino-4-deoxy-L-arabinose transferase-like glycosyltransferase
VSGRGQFKVLLKTAPLAIFVFSLLINLLTVWFQAFDGLYGQDAYSYFAHAGELYAHQSLFHHWQWEATPRILYWPFGYPGLVSLLFILTGPTPGAAQLVSLLCWSGVSALVTTIGQRLWAEQLPLAGPLAGLLLAFSALGRQAAISIMSDAAALFWTALAIWLALHLLEPVSKNKSSKRYEWWYAGGAGLALGLAIITRYAAVTALPVVGLLIWQASVHTKNRKKGLGQLVLAFSVMALVYLPQFIINQVYPERFWSGSWLASWSFSNAFQTTFNTPDGFATYVWPPLLFYLVYPFVNLHFFTLGVLLLLGSGLVVLWQKRQDSNSNATLFLLVGWWLLPVLLFSSFSYENERFSLTLMPPVALVAGLGAASLWHWWQDWVRLKAKVWYGAGLVLAGLGLGGLALFSQQHLNGFMAIKTTELTTIQQVEAALPDPDHANLLTFDLSLTFDHYSHLAVYDLSALDAVHIATVLASQPQATFLLADPANMEKQWAGTPIGLAFEAARAHTSATPLAKFGRFWLWRLSV